MSKGQETTQIEYFFICEGCQPANCLVAATTDRLGIAKPGSSARDRCKDDYPCCPTTVAVTDTELRDELLKLGFRLYTTSGE